MSINFTSNQKKIFLAIIVDLILATCNVYIQFNNILIQFLVHECLVITGFVLITTLFVCLSSTSTSPWMKSILVFATILITGLSVVVIFLHSWDMFDVLKTSKNPLDNQFQSIKLEDSKLIVYPDGCGSFCSGGIVIKQEIPIFFSLLKIS